MNGEDGTRAGSSASAAESSMDQRGDAGNASQEGATGREQDRPLTLEAVETLIERKLQPFEKRVISQSQSLIDKADRRITDRFQGKLRNLQETVGLLKEIGIEVSPEQLERAQQRLVIDGFAPQEPVQEPGSGQRSPQGQSPGQRQQTDPNEPSNPILDEAFRLQEEAGVFIGKDDPEFQDINFDGNALELLGSTKEAIDKKIARLAGGSSSQEEPGEGEQESEEERQARLAARSPGGSGRRKQSAPSGQHLGSMEHFRRGYSKGRAT